MGKGTPSSMRILPAIVSGELDQRARVINRSTSESPFGPPDA
jgi:hypothetical protein